MIKKEEIKTEGVNHILEIVGGRVPEVGIAEIGKELVQSKLCAINNIMILSIQFVKLLYKSQHVMYGKRIIIFFSKKRN